MAKRPIVYYISAHGYGHGVRSCDIVRAWNRLFPDVPVFLSTDLPASFLQNRLSSDIDMIRPGRFDVGMVQLDSVRVDVAATLQEVAALYAVRDRKVADECTFLCTQDAAVVVADIPAMPIEAARKAGLPSIAIGNFAWDWIYSAFAETDARWKPIVSAFAEGYRQADLLLRLPFAGDMSTFPRTEDLPLVASPGRERREEISSLTGCSRDKKWALLSFTTLDWDDEALARAEKLEDYELITVLPLEWDRRNIYAVDRTQVLFSDVLASVDVVVTKPGFGIMSECIVNRKPMIYVGRTDFIEYPVLLKGVEQYIRNYYLPAEQLYAGDLGEALERIWQQPDPPASIGSGGAEIAARRIMDFYEGA
jgi:L-arabinokinase